MQQSFRAGFLWAVTILTALVTAVAGGAVGAARPSAADGARGRQGGPSTRPLPSRALTGPEKERGYLLFQRPLTESIYPNTRPLADERIDSLVAFATPGQFEPVTFALYPVRALQNLKVRVSSLASSSGEVPRPH